MLSVRIYWNVVFTGGSSVTTDSQISLWRSSNRRRSRGSRRRAIFLGVVVLASLLLFSTVSLYSFLKSMQTIPNSVDAAAVPEPVPGQRINILVLGLDNPSDNPTAAVDVRRQVSRSDVMFLVSIDPETKEVGLLSIPRDTRVNIPGFGMDKINAAHAYGQEQKQSGGPALAMRSVREFLGVDVNYYVRVNVDGFRQIVNLLDGVELDIPQDMVYDDPTQNLHINLKQGRQTLDGEKAMEYVRYRSYNNADIGRIAAQQEFLKAVAHRVYSLGIILKLPALLGEFQRMADTSISPAKMTELAVMALRFDPDKLQMGTVPGTDQNIEGVDYWVSDAAKTRALVNTLIRGTDRRANAKVLVKILNGTTSAEAAALLAKRLKGYGYKVEQIGEADRLDYSTTRITNNSGEEQPFLQLVRTVMRWAPQAQPYRAAPPKPSQTKGDVTFTVIIGADFR